MMTINYNVQIQASAPKPNSLVKTFVSEPLEPGASEWTLQYELDFDNKYKTPDQDVTTPQPNLASQPS